MPVEPGEQSGAVLFAGLTDPPTDRLLDQVVRVVGEQVADRERVVEVALADEEVRRDDRRTSLGGQEYVAASDRDNGLWIFKYNP